jgi:LIVCS family branched-chain amino acid:cation transporter
MKDHQIINIGKYIFGLCFLLGNICLFGYVTTNHVDFAIGGYLLLIFGTALNLLAVLGLVIYGIACQSKLNICLRAIGILMINIPIAILYAVIGTNII